MVSRSSGVVNRAGWWRGETTSSAVSLQHSLQFIANCVSIIPHMLQLAQDHADMLLCKVAGAMTRKGYLYMVFLKVPVPRLLPSHLFKPFSPHPPRQPLSAN